jgi:hypothetical protein
MKYLSTALLNAVGLVPILSLANASLRGMENLHRHHDANRDRKLQIRSLTIRDVPNASAKVLQDVVGEEVERIVGGTQPGVDEYPFFALLGDGTGFDFCGATLIWKNILLTAAHCEPAANSDYVKLGPYGVDVSCFLNKYIR